MIDRVTPIANDGGEENYDFLDKPYMVSAALLVSNHNCSVKGRFLHLNVSFSETDDCKSDRHFYFVKY